MFNKKPKVGDNVFIHSFPFHRSVKNVKGIITQIFYCKDGYNYRVSIDIDGDPNVTLLSRKEFKIEN